MFRILYYNKLTNKQKQKTMAKTILVLTEENKNYLMGFLGDYCNKCGNTINKTAQDKLREIIVLLVKTIK